MNAEPARKGKIASFPLAVREEVNQRLLDGQSGPKILAWLNADERVLRVLDERWHEEPVSNQNLSEWRQGGYQDWLKRREQVEETKSLAGFAAKLGEAAGGSIMDGSAAILGGKFLEALQAAEPGTDLGKITRAVVALRSVEIDAQKSKQRERLLDQKERQVVLAEKQFQIRSAELFIKFYEDRRTKEIMEGKGKTSAKIEQLRLVMFGEETPDASETEKE